MKISRLNKKGAFQAEIIVQFFSYIALFLVLIVFFLLFSVKGCTDEPKIISNSVREIDANIVLLNYLRTPVENRNVADILIESNINKEYDEIDIISKKILDPLYTQGGYSWSLAINSDNDRKLLKGMDYSSQFMDYKIASAVLSSYDGKLITIILYQQTNEPLGMDVAG